MKAEIISVGTELLLGQIIDTNAAYLSARLPEIGVSLYHRSTVGDNKNRLKEAINKALLRSQIVFTIGGIGPTPDDITKESVAEVLGQELVLHQETVKKLKDFFNKISVSMTDNNLKQALMPSKGRVLENPMGTAPGSVFLTDDNKYVIVMPGPPKEFTFMYENAVLPFLREICAEKLVFESRILRIFGMGESTVAHELAGLLDNENPTVAPYVGDGDVTLRICARAENKIDAVEKIDIIQEKISNILGNVIYSFEDKSLAQTVVDICKIKNVKIAFAESCTGGLISKKITDVAGSSEVFLGGAVTYSNEMKMKMLGVPEKKLMDFGAVSKEVATEMALGMKALSNSHIAVSVTGIAGPDGGTKEKPVGLVYMAAAYKDKVKDFKFTFTGNRDSIRLRASLNAINIIRKVVLKEF